MRVTKATMLINLPIQTDRKPLLETQIFNNHI